MVYAAIALGAALVATAACLAVLRRARRREERLWGLTGEGLAAVGVDGRVPVSYTHLTLPTICSV